MRNWVEIAAKTFKAEFKEQALPYIAARIPEDLALYVESFDALKRIHKLLPFAYFALDHHGLGAQRLTTPEMERVVSLNYQHKKWGDQHNEKFAESTTLNSLHTLNLKFSQVRHDPHHGANSFERFAQSPSFTKIRTLDLDFTNLGKEALKLLMEAGSPGQFTALHLIGHLLHDEGATLLSQSMSCSHLKTLELRDNFIHHGLQILLGPKSVLTNLEELALEKQTLRADDYQYLFDHADELHPLDSLSLADCTGMGDHIEQLTHSAYMSHLSTLNLSGCYLRDEHFATISKSSQFGNLRTLILHHNGFLTHEGLNVLSTCSSLERLEFLDVSMCGRFDDLELFARASFPELTHLDLSMARHGDYGMRQLATHSTWSKLHTLKLAECELTDDAILHMVTHSSWRHLQHLDLNTNDLTDESIKALVSNPFAQHLRSLDLSSMKISDGSVEAIVTSPYLTHLERLSLACNALGPRSGHLLANTRALPSLTHLNLCDTDLGDDGGAALLRSTTLSRLTCLDLRYNQLGNGTFEALGHAYALPCLIDLDLSGNTPANNALAIQHTMESGRLNSLLTLSAKDCFRKAPTLSTMKKSARHLLELGRIF